MLSKRFASIALAASICAAGCTQGEGQDDPSPPRVRVQEVEVVEHSDRHDFLGRVEAIESVDLRARVEGFLESIDFAEGKHVEEGDRLFRIEQANYEANLKEAQARLTRARAERKEASQLLQRRLALFDADAVSQESLDEAQRLYDASGADVRSAQAALQRAKLDLEYTEIVSPISGRIGKARYTRGNLVGPESESLARVVQLDPIRVVYSVSDRERLAAWTSLKPDSLRDFEDSFVPRITLPNGDLYEHAGRIEFSGTEVDPNTGTIPVWATFPNPDSVLLPGHLVSVESQERSTHATPVVPQIALQQDRNGTFVFLVNEKGIVERRDIEKGERVGADVAVMRGLQGGERVIVAGLQSVAPGQSAEAVASAPAQALNRPRAP